MLEGNFSFFAPTKPKNSKPPILDKVYQKSRRSPASPVTNAPGPKEEEEVIHSNLAHESTGLSKSELILPKVSPVSQLLFFIDLAIGTLASAARADTLQLHQDIQESTKVLFGFDGDRAFAILWCVDQRRGDLADLVDLWCC